MTSRTAILWLKTAIGIQALLGALMVLAGLPIVDQALAPLFNLVIDPFGPTPALARETRLLAVIGGGVLIGWSLLAWHITATQIEAGDMRGVRALMIALLVWFVADSGGSILAGIPLNAVGNLAYLALFVPPLASLARFYRAAGTP